MPFLVLLGNPIGMPQIATREERHTGFKLRAGISWVPSSQARVDIGFGESSDLTLDNRPGVDTRTIALSVQYGF